MLTLRSKSFSNKPSMDFTTHEEQPEREEQPLGGPSLEADVRSLIQLHRALSNYTFY